MKSEINNKIERIFSRMSMCIFKTAKQSSMSKTEQAGLCHILCAALDSVEREIKNLVSKNKSEHLCQEYHALDRYSERFGDSIVGRIEFLIAEHFEVTGSAPWGLIMPERAYGEFTTELRANMQGKVFGLVDTFKGCKIVVSDKVGEIMVIAKNKKKEEV